MSSESLRSEPLQMTAKVRKERRAFLISTLFATEQSTEDSTTLSSLPCIICRKGTGTVISGTALQYLYDT